MKYKPYCNEGKLKQFGTKRANEIYIREGIRRRLNSANFLLSILDSLTFFYNKIRGLKYATEKYKFADCCKEILRIKRVW
jgi:hypothetical protein